MANVNNNNATLANPSSAPTQTPLTEGPDVARRALQEALEKAEKSAKKTRLSGSQAVFAAEMRRKTSSEGKTSARAALAKLIAAGKAAMALEDAGFNLEDEAEDMLARGERDAGRILYSQAERSLEAIETVSEEEGE